MNRPNKQTALEYLALNGQVATVLRPNEYKLIRPDGLPLQRYVPVEAEILVTPEALGWTQAELDNPLITE